MRNMNEKHDWFQDVSMLLVHHLLTGRADHGLQFHCRCLHSLSHSDLNPRPRNSTINSLSPETINLWLLDSIDQFLFNAPAQKRLGWAWLHPSVTAETRSDRSKWTQDEWTAAKPSWFTDHIPPKVTCLGMGQNQGSNGQFRYISNYFDHFLFCFACTSMAMNSGSPNFDDPKGLWNLGPQI